MIDMDRLRRHLWDNVVQCQRHPELPLTIYNYTRKCQYERLWDDVSLQCRGLVLDDQDRVVARPFRKFFNDTEHKDGEIPWHLPCEVTEKMDGSLLIVFWYDNAWQFATRGSFISEQARRGGDIFWKKYDDCFMYTSMTYLFEVLFPENRIVLDYGQTEDIVLLGMIETETGIEHPLDEAPQHLHIVRRLPPGADATSLRSIIRDDEEGYVVRFQNGFRVKVKGQRYMELHRILDGVSSRMVWETLSQGKSFDEVLAVVPKEFAEWVKAERDSQHNDYENLLTRSWRAYQAVCKLPTRKEQALAIMAEYKDVASAVFAMLDDKPVAPILWKKLYPEFRRPSCAARMEA